MNTADIVQLVEMLPLAYKDRAYEMLKQLVLEWNPDFTKVTPAEAESLSKAETDGWVFEEDVPMPVISAVAVNSKNVYFLFEDGTHIEHTLADYPMLAEADSVAQGNYVILADAVTWPVLNLVITIEDMFMDS